MLHVIKLIAIHRRGSERTDFPGYDKIIQRLHRLLDWGVIIKAMDDVEIEIISSKPLQTSVNLPVYGFPAEPARVEVDF